MELKATRPGAVFRVALGQVVPDDDHGDAAGQADDDQTHHVLRVTPEKDDGQQEHQDGADHPVLDQGQGQDLEVLEDLGQFLVAHLGQGRIHHQNEANGDGNVGSAHLEEGQELGETGQEITEADPGRHGQKDPQGQKALHKTQTFGNGGGHKCSYLFDIRITDLLSILRQNFYFPGNPYRDLFQTGLQPLGAFGVPFGLQATVPAAPAAFRASG